MAESLGLAAQLEYRHRPGNVFQKLARQAGQTRVGASVLRVTQTRIDNVIHRISRGRSSVTEWLSGLPLLWLTTTGAKSGEPRETPLIGVPIDENIAILGTSHGSTSTPSWVHNLDAHPSATVRVRETEVAVIARRANSQEEPLVWRAADEIYGGYTAYQQRITDREVAVFILETAS